MARLKVRARSHHNIASLHGLINDPTKHQLSIPYSLRDRANKIKIPASRSNQGHTMMMHTCTPNQCPYQESTSYNSEIYPGQEYSNARSLWKAQRSPNIAHLHPSNQRPVHISISYALQFPKYSLGKIFKLKVITARSKVKSRSHHDITQLHPLTMFLPQSISYHLRFSRYSLDMIFKLKVSNTRSKVKSK